MPSRRPTAEAAPDPGHPLACPARPSRLAAGPGDAETARRDRLLGTPPPGTPDALAARGVPLPVGVAPRTTHAAAAAASPGDEAEGHGVVHGARIGPNAVTRVIEALAASDHAPQLGEVLDEAGLCRYLARPPAAMVDEAHVIALHRALRRRLGADAFAAITRDAGLRTGDYLLAHRIPKPVQTILKLLPASPAARILLAAIGRHAWTFAGSGAFRWEVGAGVLVTIGDCPLARAHRADRPTCDFYAGTFERLFRQLVHRRTEVTETACEAMGAGACCFTLRW